jgi:membrane-bound lytic murein transglycosylase MltF
LKYALTFIILLSAFTIVECQKHLNKYDDTFKKYSKRFFGPVYDWKKFKAQGIAESGLSIEAMSQVGARGIMQLMPSTFAEVQSLNSDFENIDDPEWNIAAGIFYDYKLFKSWKEIEEDEQKFNFTLGSYNAGKGTILKAQDKAKNSNLNHNVWESIETIAPEVPKWRHTETIEYVKKINNFITELSKFSR